VSEIAAISTLNPWVAGFAALLALFTGVLFGLLPAIRMSQTPLTLSLKEGSGGSGIGSKGRRSLEVLVISEIATSLVLLSAALLMIRSFAAMHKQDLGFDSRALLTMEISLTGTHYQDSNRVDRFGREVISRLQNIPGVESAAMASALPLFGHIDMIFDIPGRSHPQGRKIMGDVQWRFVTPDYFRVLRIPLIAGRSLTNQESIKVVVISQSMARQFWPDTNPVGKTLLIGAGLGDPAFITGPTEIVGVVGDVRGRLDQAHGEPVMYLLPSQIPDRAMALMRRIDDAAILVRPQQGFSALALSQPVQNALRAVDRLPITKVQTMEQAVWNSTPQRTFNLFLFGSFAALAIGLAAVGIYGVTAYSVEQKRSEIGIRGALGATRGDIFRWVQRQALTMTVAGIVLGMAASLGLTRFIRSLLFGVTPFDTLTFVAVPIIALAVGVAAAVIPALRASRVDPVVALRIG
jgi:putative ABC transport system permease protein